MKNNATYSFLIVVGMMIMVAADGLLASNLQMIGISLGLTMMIASLLVLLLNNHDALMLSDAPGARIYQRLAVTVNVNASAREISAS